MLLAAVGVFTWFVFVTRHKPKDEVPIEPSLKVSKHTLEFSESFNKLLNDYYALSESFVQWDTVAASKNLISLKNSVDSLQYEAQQDDSISYETANTYLTAMRNDVNRMQSASDITAKRRFFNSFSNGLYEFIRVVQYDQAKVYLQECPMAFNDTETAQWLSKTNNIRNPYLGLHHPKYKSGMLECGEVKDSIEY